jgi:hypothetical protein
VRCVAVVCTGQELDVRQYVALGVALQQSAGFRVKLVTHFRYAATAAAHGLAFAGLKGDPSALVRESSFRDAVAEDSLLRIAALLKRETDATLEANLGLLHEALRVGVDAVVCSISVLTECLAVAQRYQRPCLLAPLLPYSPSGELPVAQLIAEPAKYAFLNRLSYDVSGALLWSYCGATFNRFRTQVLGVGPQSYYVLEGVPQIAAFSPSVVPPPADWWVARARARICVRTGTRAHARARACECARARPLTIHSPVPARPSAHPPARPPSPFAPQGPVDSHDRPLGAGAPAVLRARRARAVPAALPRARGGGGG